MEKEDVLYLYNGISLSHQKEGNLEVSTAQIDLESLMPSEISQTKKDKVCTLYHLQTESFFFFFFFLFSISWGAPPAY